MQLWPPSLPGLNDPQQRSWRPDYFLIFRASLSQPDQPQSRHALCPVKWLLQVKLQLAGGAPLAAHVQLLQGCQCSQVAWQGAQVVAGQPQTLQTPPCIAAGKVLHAHVSQDQAGEAPQVCEAVLRDCQILLVIFK